MKRKWLALLLASAVIFIGTGLYLKTGPEWTKNTYYDYYNRGVSAKIENRTEESLNDFTRVANDSKNPWLISLALSQSGYLIGRQAFNAELSAESRFQIVQQAIGLLQEAVSKNPDNGEAKYNLELLKNQLPGLLREMAEGNNDSGKRGNPGSGYSHGYEERGY